MDLSNLTKSFIYKDLTILNEAESEDDILAMPKKDSDNKENSNAEDNNDKENDEKSNSDDSSNDDDNNSENSDNQDGDLEQYNEEDNIDTTKLKILSSLSDSEYKLCNLRCLRNFHELDKQITDTINNNIMNIRSTDKKHGKIINHVLDNLYSMQSDLLDYIQYKFGDVYEDNVITYITYLKRYRTAIKLINMILLEDKNNA